MSACRCSRQPAMHRHPTSPFSVHGPEGWELHCSPHALSSGSLQRQKRLFCQAFESHRMFGEGFEQRFTLVIMVHFALRGRLGSVPALMPCIQDTAPRLISSRCSADRMTQGWITVQRDQNLLQTMLCSFSEHRLFSSSPKFEKTQLNWMGLSELHFLYQGQRIKELNKPAL